MVNASPYRETCSPYMVSASPYMVSAFPYRETGSDDRVSGSPYKETVSPYRESSSPYKETSSPDRVTASTYKESASPYKETCSPYKETPSPYQDAAFPYLLERIWSLIRPTTSQQSDTLQAQIRKLLGLRSGIRWLFEDHSAAADENSGERQNRRDHSQGDPNCFSEPAEPAEVQVRKPPEHLVRKAVPGVR